MISEKESYEEIVTGSIYNETTIADQIHTKWAGKTVHFAKTDSTNLSGSSVWRKKAHQRELLHWQSFSGLEEAALARSLGSAGGNFCYDEHSS